MVPLSPSPLVSCSLYGNGTEPDTHASAAVFEKDEISKYIATSDYSEPRPSEKRTASLERTVYNLHSNNTFLNLSLRREQPLYSGQNGWSQYSDRGSSVMTILIFGLNEPCTYFHHHQWYFQAVGNICRQRLTIHHSRQKRC